jgi:hypothetical protein
MLFLLSGWIMGCGSDEGSPVRLPANVLGSWRENIIISVPGFTLSLEDLSLRLEVNRAVMDSSIPSGTVKVDGVIRLPIPCPLDDSLITEDLSCPSNNSFSFQAGEVKGNVLTIKTEVTTTVRSGLPSVKVPLILRGNVSGNKIIGSYEIVVDDPSAPNGGFRLAESFELVSEGAPSPSFNNLKNAPLAVLGDWSGEWSNDVTEETGAIRASFSEIFVTPDTPLDVVEVGISHSLFPISTQCFSDLVDLTSSGQINGNTFTLKVPFNGQDISINFIGTRENNQISGTFEITGTEGACLGHTGTWRIKLE